MGHDDEARGLPKPGNDGIGVAVVDIDEFIERWKDSGGSEMATAQTFDIELTELLDVPCPNVSDKDGNFLDYRYERPVIPTHTGRKRNGRIDLYKKVISSMRQSSLFHRIPRTRTP